MKKRSLLIVALLFATSFLLNAQAPPNPPGNASNGGGPVGGNAPIGSGMAIMLVMGAAYAGWKRSEQ